MNFKVICRRGGTTYLVEREQEGDYCLVDLLNGTFRSHKLAIVFLKMDYFEDVDEVPADVTEAIAEILSDPANRRNV